MTQQSVELIPEPYGVPFKGVIDHPELMLWDSWCYSEDDQWHLYCLALSKKNCTGKPVLPHDRNKHQFHIRHFVSKNEGATWADLGVFQQPRITTNGYFDRNIWSGSALLLNDNRVLFGFTGIRQPSPARPFLQSIGLAISSKGNRADYVLPEPISCPLRDYEKITALGYYLGSKASLGHKDGESGGPILAWRDPFLFQDNHGAIQMVWSAKVTPTEGAMAHATLRQTSEGFEIEALHPPVKFPDSELFTQAEVPKIYYNKNEGEYFCVLAACDRLYEGQDDSEVSKVTRLYRSQSFRGPWVPFEKSGSRLDGLDHLFGGSIIETDFDAREMTMLAPYTEMADTDLELTFAAPIKISY